MNRKEFHTQIVKHLCQQPWVQKSEIEELDAVISHWIQSPSSHYPYLTNAIWKEIYSLMAAQENAALLNNNKDACHEEIKSLQPYLEFIFDDLPYPPPQEYAFTFIDLFAGIGGFRLAFQGVGGKCIFSCEWDKYAKQTYEANFGEYPYGDIRKINKNEIPNHDILCAGFPCQPFSLAGVSKKKSLGRKHGFEDETQGTLFFEIKEILRIKRPKAFMLENVKNLLNHDKGKTFEVIRHALEDQLGYVINWDIVDGAKWVPQHRERIFIVGYDPKQVAVSKDEIVIPKQPDDNYMYPELKKIISKKVEGHTLGPGTWATLERHKNHHAEAGNGFGYGLLTRPMINNTSTVTRTISARYHKDGAEVLIEQPGLRPRRLTVKEAMQLMGYDPAKFAFPVSDTQAYRQIGNSIVVPAVKATALEMSRFLKK